MLHDAPLSDLSSIVLKKIKKNWSSKLIDIWIDKKINFALVQNLLSILASRNEFTVLTLAAGILSNLTCNNENNKKAALAANGIQILLHTIHANMQTQKTQLVDPCVCALRHITNRHGDMLLAQEQVRAINGIQVITQLMCIQPRAWSVIKAVLGLVRNFCSNQLNAQMLRQNGMFVCFFLFSWLKW